MTLPESESGNENLTTVPEGGIAAEINVESSDTCDELKWFGIRLR